MPMLLAHTVCRPWPGRRRCADSVTPEALAPLVNAIRRDGGLKNPATVRSLPHGQTYAYEIISGLRRFYAIKYLACHGEQYGFLAETRDLSDADAFALNYAENHNRENLPAYDQGCEFAEALRSYFYSNRSDMAKRLGMSPSALDRYLACAAIPPEVVAAYPNTAAITVNDISRLRATLRNPQTAPTLVAAARRIAAGRTLQNRLEAGEKIPQAKPAEITRQLLAAVNPAPKPRAAPLNHTVEHKIFGTLARGEIIGNAECHIVFNLRHASHLGQVLGAIAEIIGVLVTQHRRAARDMIKTLKKQGMDQSVANT